MTAANLYDNHWLLAYEAHEQGWLPSRNGNDYVGSDAFFSILRSHGVRFYGAGLAPSASFFWYTEEEVDPTKITVGEMPAHINALPPGSV